MKKGEKGREEGWKEERKEREWSEEERREGGRV